MGKNNRKEKKPKQAVKPTGGKQPRGAKKAELSEELGLVWNCEIFDSGGQWSWNTLDARTWWREIIRGVLSFNSMKWSEILGDRHHEVNVGRIIKAAQDRLREIGQQDIESLVSLALSGTKRIWGIRDRNVFKVLWWDPEHEVCPSMKKHT